MNHIEIEIYDDIHSSDTIKQTNGLSKLNLYWINQGKDPAIFYNSLVKILNETDNRTAKIQCYNIMKSIKATTSEFLQLIPIIVKDLANDDPEVVISILKILPNISDIFTELLLVGNADFRTLVRHQNQSIRRLALDTLISLLFYKKAVLNNSYKSFVTTGWDLIVERILEEPLTSIYLSSFEAISNIFSEINRSVSHSDECDSNSTFRRQALSKIADSITLRLVDHFDLLFERALLIEQSKRHQTVNTLAFLADAISRAATTQPYWPSGGEIYYKSQPLRIQNSQKTTPQTIVGFLVDYYISLLDSSFESLVFAAGKAILDLLLTQKNQHRETWINPVITAFIGLLKRDGLLMAPLPILLALYPVFQMISDDLLFSTLTRVFPSIKLIQDSNQRVSYLIKIFELIIDRHVTSNGKSQLFNPLLQADQSHSSTILTAFQDDTSSFREEIVISLVASHHNILNKYLTSSGNGGGSGFDHDHDSGSSGSGSSGGNKIANSSILYHLHQASLNISEICLKSLMWQCEDRISAIEYSIRFVDWLCRVTLSNDSPQVTKLVSLLRSEILEQVHMIPSDYICLQSIFLLGTHLLRSPTNKFYEQSDSSLLVGVLRRRFLFLDNQPKYTQFNGSVREILMGVSQYAKTSPAQLHNLSALWLGAIECLFLLGLHIPSSESSVQRTLDDILTTYPHNKSVYQRARFVKRLLFSSASALPNTMTGTKCSTIRNISNFTNGSNPIDFQYCIPIELLETSNSLKSHSDIFAYECKKAITGLAGVHYGSSIRDKPSKDIQLISSSSDPVWVEIHHVSHPTLNTITLYIQITNVIQFVIKNLIVLVGFSGHLELPFAQTQSKHHISKLLPDKTYQIDIPLQVTGLDQNSVSVKLTFTQPSGIGEVETTIENPKRTKTLNSTPLPSTSNTGNTTQSPTHPNHQTTTSSIPNNALTSSTNNATVTSPTNNTTQQQHPTSPTMLSYVANATSNPITTIPKPNDAVFGPGSNSPFPNETVGIQFVQPFEINCMDYQFEWNQFLIPFKYNKHQFLQQWPRFESVYSVDVVFEGFVTPQLLSDCLDNYPFHKVQSGYFSQSNFQFAYAASTWFNDQFCFQVSGMEKPSAIEQLEFINPTYQLNNSICNRNNNNCNNNNNNNNLSSSGSTTPSFPSSTSSQFKVIHARFEFRSSTSSVLAVFQNLLENWVHKIPRYQDNFVARKLYPGEESIFNITKIQEPFSTSSDLKLNSNAIADELLLLSMWKDKKTNDQSKKATKGNTQLSLEQDFY